MLLNLCFKLHSRKKIKSLCLRRLVLETDTFEEFEQDPTQHL